LKVFEKLTVEKNKHDMSQNMPITKALSGEVGDKKCGKQVGSYTSFRIFI
jgi:hypothetical protein